MKEFSVEIVIRSTAEKVWAILTDAPAYPSWNSTVTKVEGQIAAGGRVTVHAKLNPGRAFPVSVSEFIPSEKMVWTGGMPLGLFKGERTYRLVPEGDGVKFSMHEVFTGLLSPIIEKSLPDLQPAFNEFAACLKKQAEKD